MTDLIAQRKDITTRLSYCEPGAFPGSAASRKESAILSELAAFDAAHPEIIGEIRSRKTAEPAGATGLED